MKPVIILGGIAALVSPFFFPWPFAFFIACAVSLFVPPIALVWGALTEFLYFSGVGVPYFLITGIVVSVVTYFVHQFVKTRIIE
jgi:hypothetical protein